MKLFVSYQLDKMHADGVMRSVFGNCVTETADAERITYDDILSAEADIRDGWKTVGARVISFHRLDD